MRVAPLRVRATVAYLGVVRAQMREQGRLLALERERETSTEFEARGAVHATRLRRLADLGYSHITVEYVLLISLGEFPRIVDRV